MYGALVRFFEYNGTVMSLSKLNLNLLSSAMIVASLGRELEAVRLQHNISQAELAREAGVSRRTITRMAEGKAMSLDSFVRVLKALKLVDNLVMLLPDTSISPVEIVARANERGQPYSVSANPNNMTINAQGKKRRVRRKTKAVNKPWSWGDE